MLGAAGSNDADANFCSKCGKSLKVVPEEVLAPTSAAAGGTPVSATVDQVRSPSLLPRGKCARGTALLATHCTHAHTHARAHTHTHTGAFGEGIAGAWPPR